MSIEKWWISGSHTYVYIKRGEQHDRELNTSDVCILNKKAILSVRA